MTLPGLRYVGYADARTLQPDIPVRAKAGEPVAALARFTPVAFVGIPLAGMETDTDDGGGEIQTATLTFRTERPVDFGAAPAFKVIDIAGREFLIGSKEPPWPVVKQTRTTGTPDGDPAGCEYTVTHTSIRTLIPTHD